MVKRRTKSIAIPGHKPSVDVAAFTRTQAHTEQYLRRIWMFGESLHLVDQRIKDRVIATCHPGLVELEGQRVVLSGLTRFNILKALEEGHVYLASQEGNTFTLESFVKISGLGKRLVGERTHIIELFRGTWDRKRSQSEGPEILLGDIEGVLEYDDRVLITDSEEAETGILIRRFEERDDEATRPEKMMHFKRSPRELNPSLLLEGARQHGKMIVYRGRSPVSELEKVLVAEKFEPSKHS